MQVISTPGMNLIPSDSAADFAEDQPDIVSWSVSDQNLTFDSAIILATSATGCSPSLLVEWL
jgi:hypothetical protein